MHSSIEEKKNRYLEELSYLPDSYERFTWLVDYGRRLPELPAELKIEQFKVEGCMSTLWIVPRRVDGLCLFQADSDSAVVKGMAGLLCDLYSNESPEAILSLEPDFLAEVGVLQHLSSNRRNGLTKVRERIARFAKESLVEQEAEGKIEIR